jgi:predicted dehydrogenase
MNRKLFLKRTAGSAVALFAGTKLFADQVFKKDVEKGKRIGIIGLDTTHSIAFTKLLNDAGSENIYNGYKVVAAYPYGSRELALSKSRIPVLTEEIKKFGVQVTESLQELFLLSDVILLETNDGRIHKQQAMEVIRAGKPMFIDKPIAASLQDAWEIFAAAEKYKVPVFSSSALRYLKPIEEIKSGKYGAVNGADTFSPALIEPSHPDLFWYGIHGVEALYALMGTGCVSVQRHFTPGSDFVSGTWKDGRIGNFRGLRAGKTDFGGTCYCEKEIVSIGTFTGYESLVKQITGFFESGISPVTKEETLELITFLEAAELSKKLGGRSVQLEAIVSKLKKVNI